MYLCAFLIAAGAVISLTALSLQNIPVSVFGLIVCGVGVVGVAVML